MTEPVKKLYNEAKNNKEYQNQLKQAGEKKHKPSLFWSNDTRVLFATAYFGWKVARGEWNESDYQ